MMMMMMVMIMMMQWDYEWPANVILLHWLYINQYMLRHAYAQFGVDLLSACIDISPGHTYI